MNVAAQTLDGWYVLHDLRTMDWASWKLISKEERQAAVDDPERKDYRQLRCSPESGPGR